jgi:putative oxidoreductase
MVLRGYRRITARLARGRDLALLATRLAAGWFMLLHGLQKLQPPGGTTPFQHLLAALGNVPFPGVTGAVLPWVEVTGGALLLAGALTRIAAIVLGCEMAIIIGLVKLTDLHASLRVPLGSPGASTELEFLYLAGLVTLFLLGPGRLSIDAAAGLETRVPQARAGQPAAREAGLRS